MMQAIETPHVPPLHADTSGGINVNDDDTSFFRDIAFSRNQAFNKASYKVNPGLPDLGGPNYPGQPVYSSFPPNIPVVSVAFSSFLLPNNMRTHPIPPRRSEEHSEAAICAIIQRLLAPPLHAFVHGSLTLNWVVATAGKQEFETRDCDGRFVLKKGSLLRTKGREMGMPGAYWEWMCGDDEEVGASEGALLLTREFFEKEV